MAPFRLCRLGFSVVVVLAVGACAGTRPAPEGSPVWPPPAVSSPGEIAWVDTLTEVKPGGMGRVFKAVAGQEQRTSKWGFRRPTSVAVFGNQLAVVDGGSGSVVLADRDGDHAKRLDLPDGFLPIAVTVSHDGATWFVADGPTGEVRRFDNRGRSTGVIHPIDGVVRCGGLAATKVGDLLMTDVDAGELLRLAPDGTVVARVGGRGVEPGEFNHPTAVVEDPDGTVWVLDALNFRIQHLDPQLRYLGQFGAHGDGSGHLALPRGLTIDPDGHLYVSDAQFDLIQLFDSEGRLLLAVGRRGNGRGEFWSPAGLACDANGNLVCADSGNRRIQIMRYRKREESK